MGKTAKLFFLIMVLSANSTFLILYRGFPPYTNFPESARQSNRSSDSGDFNSNRCNHTHISLPKRILTFDSAGRLGNQMFAYATLYAAAKYKNQSSDIFLTPSMSNHLSKYFKLSACPIPVEIFKNVNWTRQEITADFDTYRHIVKTKDTPSPDYLQFVDYPESWKYFDDFRELIREEFEFRGQVKKMAKNKLVKLTKSFVIAPGENVTIIGIHVRRGDYAQKASRLGFVLPTMKFYKGAMDYFQNKYGRSRNVIFIVASDDIWWCIRNFSPLISESEFRIKFLAPDSPSGFDLAVLANCDHVIFGIGTFGWWGGYLSEGETVFCSDCVLPSGWVMVTFYKDYSNFVLPNWIGVTRNGTLSTNRVKMDRKSKMDVSECGSDKICQKMLSFISLFL